MLASNLVKPCAGYRAVLLQEFPVLEKTLGPTKEKGPDFFEDAKQYSTYLKYMSELSVLNETRMTLFTPEKFVIDGLRPFSCAFDAWDSRNPSESEKQLVYRTVNELATLFNQIKYILDVQCLTKDPASFLEDLHEVMIRVNEIFYDVKGLWGTRYPDPTTIITGFYYRMYEEEPTKQPFLYRLYLSFSNGFPPK